jgi:hypothetical protein|tara:strand:+ start:2092 stop:2976 length:885 start_codon:yes stop_codon:yes gene_type:complete
MFVFKEIDKSSTVIESNIVNYTQNLSTSSAGVKSIKIVSGSISSSYWSSLNVMFYTSGSSVYGNELKFSRPSSNLSIQPTQGKQFLSKYHGYPSSSIIQIPSQYYGEKIKQGSFKFTDLNNTDNSSNKPIIIDDGFGNLYSTNAHHSQSTNNATSSDNYVGNIFYDKGLAVITETGSWSGSVNYSDLATNFTLKFDSYNTIRTHEYNVTLLPQDYNLTTNYSIRNVLSGSLKPLTLSTQYVASPFTGSDFQPYITTINLYQNGDYDTPVIQATLPKPIRKSDKINTRFKIKLDM